MHKNLLRFYDFIKKKISLIEKKSGYILPIILFIITSSFVLLTSLDIFQYKFLGSADFISPIDIENNFLRRFFVYNPYLYGGVNSVYLVAHIFPEFLIFYIGNIFHLSPLIISLIYIASIIFLAQLSMYYFLTYVASNKLKIKSVKTKILVVLFSVFYGFSPSLAGLMAPGHFIQSIPYVLFPLLLKQLDIILSNSAPGKKPFIIIYLIFLLSATAFANVGIVYTIVLTLMIYIFLAWIVQRISFKKILKSTAIVFLLLFLANVWWVIAFASTLDDLTGADPKNYYINTAINIAVQKASVLNIFLGKPEGQLYLLSGDYYTSPIAIIAFITIALFFMLAVVNLIKNRYVIMLAILSVIGVFLTKGPREPFADFYMFLYDNVLGFQSFRRPVSKYWGIFMIFYLTVAFIGALIVSKKLNPKKYILFILLPLTLIASYYLFAFLSLGRLTPFTIPNYYYQARDDLTRSNASKILLLPGTYGFQPIYNNSINGLYASDLLQYIWDFSLVAPDASEATPNELQKKKINSLVKSLEKNQNTCRELKELGITHIMVREDQSKELRTEDTVLKVLSYLDQNPNIASKKSYRDRQYRGFTIYKVKSDCISNLVTLPKQEKSEAIMNYSIQNPTRIKIEIKNIKKAEELIFLNNFRSVWKLYPVPYAKNYIEVNNKNRNSFLSNADIFDKNELTYLWEKPIAENKHTVAYEYANKWTIVPKEITKNYSSNYFTSNSDGSINMQFVLYYENQAFVAFGFLIFVTSLVGGIIYLAIKRK